MDLVIRQAKLYDVPAMARIEREAFDEPWSAAEITKDVTAGGGLYVAAALLDEEIAGYAEIRIVAGEAQVYNIAVAAEKRREGIGEALLRHMIEKAEESGCTVLNLEVMDGNEAAMELYRKLGFREVGRRKGYYAKGRRDAVLMDLALGKVEIDIEV
jgi:ribosomal-protein-alanine N-acetyltransferase